jgi:hypothetical protein
MSMATCSAKVRVLLLGACLTLTLPALGQVEPAPERTTNRVTILADSHIRPVADKIEDAKSKLGQLVRERRTFNPFRHKGDLAIVISSIGAIFGGLRLYVALRKRHAKRDQPPRTAC